MLFFCVYREYEHETDPEFRALRELAVSGGFVLRRYGRSQRFGNPKFKVHAWSWSMLLAPLTGKIIGYGRGWPLLVLRDGWTLAEAVETLYKISHGVIKAEFPAGPQDPINRTRLGNRKKRKKPEPVDYQEYIRSSEWNKKRLRALRAAGYRCGLCSTDTDLQVHHRTYEKLGNEPLRHLLVLCGNCHASVHGKQKLADSDKEFRAMFPAVAQRSSNLNYTDNDIYREYRNSDRFIAKAERLLGSVRGCSKCGKRCETSDVYHTKRDRIPSEPLRDLVAICQPCVHGVDSQSRETQQ